MWEKVLRGGGGVRGEGVVRGEGCEGGVVCRGVARQDCVGRLRWVLRGLEL